MAMVHLSPDVRRLVLAVAGSTLVAAALASCGDPQSQAATDPSAAGWKTVEYRGVRVEVPADWTRTDMEPCEFQFERWAPPELPACGPGAGVSFYASAIFDPAHGPGIRHDEAANDAGDWAGYVYAGDVAVYAADDDRRLVQHVLRSAHAPGE